MSGSNESRNREKPVERGTTLSYTHALQTRPVDKLILLNNRIAQRRHGSEGISFVLNSHDSNAIPICIRYVVTARKKSASKHPVEKPIRSHVRRRLRHLDFVVGRQVCTSVAVL